LSAQTGLIAFRDYCPRKGELCGTVRPVSLHYW
jgi:hypothetical protein